MEFCSPDDPEELMGANRLWEGESAGEDPETFPALFPRVPNPSMLKALVKV